MNRSPDPYPHLDEVEVTGHEVIVELIRDEDTLDVQLDGPGLELGLLLIKGCHAGQVKDAGELNGTLRSEGRGRGWEEEEG